MNLLRRNIGRRVAGVGVGVALLMLGLEGPAFAAAPTVTSFTPTSGPLNCVVDITGTNFNNPPVTSVKFGTTEALTFTIVSDTEIWAASPLATTGTSAFIILTKGATGETGSSTTQFTPSSSGCEPTVTSFAPTCGLVGTTVAITGTNLLTSSGTITTIAGGTVQFSPFNASGVGQPATHTGTAETPTSLSVLVPATAKTGIIKVTTAGGSVFSTGSFTVVTDPALCAAPAPTEHARSITLKLAKALVAKGKVSVGDAFTDCAASVPVKIQRRVSGHWKTVGKTTTTDTGAYKKAIKNRHGKYRSLAPKVTLNDGADLCLRAKSRVVRH